MLIFSTLRPLRPKRRGEQPRMANKLIDKNKINKESKSNQTAQDKGVGSTGLLYLIITLCWIN